MRLFNFLANQPWAITEAYARRMMEIYDLAIERKARGEKLDKDALEKELGRSLDNTRQVTVRNGVATLPIEGPIFRRADMFTDISGATTIDTLAKDFNQALTDPNIAAIILLIDSPGGEVNGVSEFADMVFAARGSKPITAYVGHSAASAAYWIASAAGEVVIDHTAQLGSIGVVVSVTDPAKENKRTIEFVSSQSPNKRPDPTTETGKAQLQSFANDIADVFVNTVARNRNVSSETVVKDFGGGALLVGQKAVDAGLADRVGSYEQVLGELAGYSGENKMSKSADDKTLGQKIMALLKGDEVEASEPAGDRDELKALRAKAAQAEKYQEQIKAARKSEAEAFAGGLITGKHVYPAAKEKIEDAYIQAAEDDEASPLASSSRVEKFKASFADLPKHTLTTEQMKSDLPEGSAVLNPTPTEEESLKAAEAGARAWAEKQNPKVRSVAGA